MEEEHYRHHHHHHHRHGHQTTDQNQSQASEGAEVQQQQTVVTRASAPVTVPRPTGQARLTAPGGVQATSSFHSVSSIDSSAEMAKYFPDAQTPSLSPFRHHQDEGEEHAQSTPATAATNITSVSAAATYATVPALPRTAATSNVSSVAAPRIAPPTVQRPQVPPMVRPQPPPGIPSYSSQIEGLTISQALVNDVIVDLQSKVINESQQQYLSESTTGNYMEPLPPIHIRAPNPTIILQSDLNRLRAEFQRNVRARAQQQQRGGGGFNQPRFQAPPAQQYSAAPGYY